MAQLDNAADSDSEERGFESLQAGQQKRTFVLVDKGSFFELSVPLARNVKYTSQVKRGYAS